jgi:hypothetical protein
MVNMKKHKNIDELGPLCPPEHSVKWTRLERNVMLAIWTAVILVLGFWAGYAVATGGLR